MAEQVKILNMMFRGFTLTVKSKDATGKLVPKTIIIPSREAKVVDKEEFDAAVKNNRALKSYLDQKLLVTAKSSDKMVTPHEEELQGRTNNAKRPEELKDTRTAKEKDGKVKHESKKVEAVEVEQGDKAKKGDAPEGGKRE